ncbi:hypothetical protein HCJ25_05830 [Listeria sp. FSL L7-1426]|uniref:hypothetical protein n=1 Tax=Listeria cossartiae TaxID=2838249 RepID=UPI001625E725|nr:hypothetical protein [Listeria cossartiae]MBC1571177.1 hypothetical protein [Listeria cossartiae subsp. cossartiae]
MQSFSNKDEANKYLKEALEEKYGESFDIHQEEKYATYPTADSYSAIMVAENDPEYKFRAWASSNNELKDNYAAIFFSKDAEKIVENIIKQKSFIKDITVTLEAPITEKKWTLEDNLTDYLEQSGAYNKVNVTLNPNLEMDVYVNQVDELLKELYGCGTNIELKVNANSLQIFYYKFSDQGTKKLTQELIRVKIIEEQDINRSRGKL